MFLNLETSADEFINLKEAYLQAKTDLFAFEMSAKQLPQRFYTVLRSKRGIGGGIYQRFVTDSDEHRQTQKS